MKESNKENKKEVKHEKEKLSEYEILELMGVFKPRYYVKKGRIRQR